MPLSIAIIVTILLLTGLVLSLKYNKSNEQGWVFIFFLVGALWLFFGVLMGGSLAPSPTWEKEKIHLKVMNKMIREDKTFDLFLEDSSTIHFTNLNDLPLLDAQEIVYTKSRNLYHVVLPYELDREETLKSIKQ